MQIIHLVTSLQLQMQQIYTSEYYVSYDVHCTLEYSVHRAILQIFFDMTIIRDKYYRSNII